MPGVTSDRHHYLSSLVEELSAQSARVRDLIGSRHWLSDGHHKEYILASVIRRHLPSGILLGRGFVISPTDSEGCSREQDLLLVDCTREAPLFNQGGLLIVFPDQLLASISVKTTLRPGEINNSVQGLNSVRTLFNLASVDPSKLWCGIFCFEVSDAVIKNPRLPCKYLSDAISRHPMRANPISTHSCVPGPDMLCASRDLLYKVLPADAHGAPCVSGLRCETLATAVFLANLLDHIARCRGNAGSNIASFMDALTLETL